MVIDPVCKMEIDESTALSAHRNGQAYYFCSEHCRQKFQAENPDKTDANGRTRHKHGRARLLPSHKNPGSDHGSAGASPSREFSLYVCPMCPGVESDKPGSCPKCGMALERATPAPSKSKTIYTCPMHPEIEQEGPGDCPIVECDWNQKPLPWRTKKTMRN